MQEVAKASPVLPSLMLMADMANTSANVHQSALPATAVLAPWMFSSGALSAADLMNTTAATPEDLQNLSQRYMTDAANLHRAPTEVGVFGSGKQTEDASPLNLKQGLPEDGVVFLGHYSRALVMQGLSLNNSYSRYFTKSDRDTMRYYFTGSARGCLSQDPSFNNLTDMVARAAFMTDNAQLQSYIDDPQDWALLLFKYLMSDAMLVNAAYQSVSSGDAQMNKYCMLLHVLDTQSRNFSMLYIKALRLKIGLQLSYGNIAVGPNFGTEIQAIITQIINNVIANPNDMFYQLFSEDVQALQKECSTDVATTIAEQALSDDNGIGLGFEWAVTSMSTRPANAPKVAAETVPQPQVVGEGTGRCGKMFKAIKEKCNTPKSLRVFGAMKTLVTFAVAAYSIHASIEYLLNWNDLSTASHAQAILSVVSSTASILGGVKNIATIIQQIRAADPDTLAGKAIFIELSQSIGAQGPPVAIAQPADDEDFGIKYFFPEEEYEAVDAGNGDMNERIGRTVSNAKSAEMITERFGIMEKKSAVINVALNISTCICIGFQIKKDFDENHHTGVKLLDILNEVANSAQVITGIDETVMMVASIDTAAIPVVGIVVAVLCIIINFIELGVQDTPPEGPIQQYLDEFQDSYISSLPRKPKPALTYTVNPTQINSSGPVALTFSVANTEATTQSKTTVNSLFFQFSVGSVESNLFATPVLASPAKNTAASNTITYAITSGGDDFIISGPPMPTDGSGSISVKVQAKNSAGSPVPATGLVFTITGTGNGVAGVAQVIINESTNNRPDQEVLPSTDVQETLQLTKS
ncbi:hypothetical protein FHETE_11093 [Fusarium heterosporum]|uniref:Uncharacterized protein n=1 Tax=Fusarium heterosporum TaxID=42747 RepID=A0A8H5WFC2_FUSHE|nr:hypothetical protein FHETE_11093 [Fusarium heterosporum]